MNDIRLPTKTFRNKKREEVKIKEILDENKTKEKKNSFSVMDETKEYDTKKLPVEEEIKMDWWDKFVGGIKEGRITIWFWIIILIGMIFAFSVSTVKIDFNIEGDINYKHPEIFQLKGDLND